ncbi:hypothetical protein [Psychrobacillus phage Perkons]|nr:hypothetical protein [Psychrobacillus phage Perkons]
MSPVLAFILAIALIPILLILVWAFIYVVADGVVSTMDDRPSETERIVKDVMYNVRK